MYVTTHPVSFGFGSWVGEQPAAQIDWCQMRQTIAATARAEHARWTGPGPHHRQILESDPTRLPILRQYWAAVPVADPAANAIQSARDNANFAWSAAFICFVMRRSGVLPAHGFHFSGRHITFIVGALRNRERSIGNFWLVDRTEIQREVAPEPGDILCFNRCIPARPEDVCGRRAGMIRTTHSYESLRSRFWERDQHVVPTGNSHSAIVVGLRDVGGRRVVETIGGNEDNSVRVTPIPIGQNDLITNPEDHHIFGMIKIVGCR
jgi:hypothetical protein